MPELSGQLYAFLSGAAITAIVLGDAAIPSSCAIASVLLFVGCIVHDCHRASSSEHTED